jgi:hypothetical protein
MKLESVSPCRGCSVAAARGLGVAFEPLCVQRPDCPQDLPPRLVLPPHATEFVVDVHGAASSRARTLRSLLGRRFGEEDPEQTRILRESTDGANADSILGSVSRASTMCAGSFTTRLGAEIRPAR